MGIFGKVKKAAKKTVKSGANTTYRSVLKPMGKDMARGAKRTYRDTAGKLIRSPNVSPRKAYKAARRVVTAPFKVTRTLKRQTEKTKRASKKRPRR